MNTDINVDFWLFMRSRLCNVHINGVGDTSPCHLLHAFEDILHFFDLGKEELKPKSGGH
jgi:hypothetical protein